MVYVQNVIIVMQNMLSMRERVRERMTKEKGERGEVEEKEKKREERDLYLVLGI